MTLVSIAELKARLSEFIALAKRGEDVIVTDRGRPVAQLTPLHGATADNARLDELIRAGAVRTPAKKLPKTFLTPAGKPDRTGALLNALLEERADSR
jgi:prevent-host-death family protein